MTAVLIVVLVVAVVLIIGGWLTYQLLDRRDHRRFVTGLSVLGGPDNARAGGDAFRSVGEAPTLQARTTGARLALGRGGPADEDAPARGNGARPQPDERRDGNARRPNSRIEIPVHPADQHGNGRSETN